MRVATMHASLGLLLVLTPQTAADWSAGKDEDPDSLQSMWSAWMRPDQVENANILAGVHTKSTTTSRHHPPPPAPPDTSEHPDCAPACRRDWAENCPKPGCLTCRTCERLFPRHPPPAIPSPKPPPPAAPPWCTDSLDMRTDARTISNPGGPLGKWCHQLQEEDCEKYYERQHTRRPREGARNESDTRNRCGRARAWARTRRPSSGRPSRTPSTRGAT